MLFRSSVPLSDYGQLLTDAELKRHTRTGDDDLPQLRDYLFAAMQRAEDYCRQPLFLRTFTAIGYAPLTDLPGMGTVTVTAISYQHGLETAVTLTTEFYRQSANRLTYYGTHGIYRGDLITVTFTAGFVPASVPHSIKQAVRVMVESYYNSRDDSVHKLPTLSESLLEPYVFRS